MNYNSNGPQWALVSRFCEIVSRYFCDCGSGEDVTAAVDCLLEKGDKEFLAALIKSVMPCRGEDPVKFSHELDEKGEAEGFIDMPIIGYRYHGEAEFTEFK